MRTQLFGDHPLRRCAHSVRSISERTISVDSLASSVHSPVPQKWRGPVLQRSRLVRRTGPAHSRVEFAHPSEQEFARFLDYYRIRWQYEPVSFPIGWEGERVAEMFTPDFYLPEHDLYIELTTMKQSLASPKNRKERSLLYALSRAPDQSAIPHRLPRPAALRRRPASRAGQDRARHRLSDRGPPRALGRGHHQHRAHDRLRPLGAARAQARLARGRDLARTPTPTAGPGRHS